MAAVGEGGGPLGGGDRRVELLAVVRDHVVLALHRADRRLEDGAAGIPEPLARLQVRLFADDAVADHLLHLAVGVGDEPVARHEAGRLRPFVADRDRVREHVLVARRVRLVGEIRRLHRDRDVVFSGFSHWRRTTFWRAIINPCPNSRSPPRCCPPTSRVSAKRSAPSSPPVQVSNNYFYETLSPYGSWVNVDGYGMCWRPTVAVVNPGWQPYADRGRWVYRIT